MPLAPQKQPSAGRQATEHGQNTFGAPDTPELRQKFVATIPMGRMSTPRDIANAALFLASDEAEFLTGVVMEVDSYNLS